MKKLPGKYPMVKSRLHANSDVPSPCVAICTLNENLCIGCGRTIAEITGWTGFSTERQSEIVAAARQRLAACEGATATATDSARPSNSLPLNTKRARTRRALEHDNVTSSVVATTRPAP